MPGFSEHFSEKRDAESFRFVVCQIVEEIPRNGTVVETFRDILLATKTDPTVTADLLAAAGWDVAIGPLVDGLESVARGDFGELIATEAIESFDDLVVPVRKLRYQIDPSQTLPGSDVVGFAIGHDGEIERLDYTESKFRAQPPRNIAVSAHDQLGDDFRTRFATTLRFIAHRLQERNDPLYEPFIGYLSRRDDRLESFAVCLTCDAQHWDDVILDDLEDLPELLVPLQVRVCQLEAVEQLIQDVCALLGWEVIDDDE